MAVSGWSFFMRLLCWRFIRASVFFHFLLFLISLLHKPVFLSYLKRNMFFVLVQNMEKQPSMCVWSVLGFSVFSCYIFFPWITLSLSPYIYGRMICFLPSPCIYGFCYLTFFFWDQNMLFENQQAATWTLHSWFIYNLLRSLLAFLIFQSASVLYMAWMQITSPTRW